MRLVLGNLFRHSPLENTLRHAETVARCGPIFVNAVKSYFENDRDKFEFLKEDIREIENEADRMKRNMRAHLPSSLLCLLTNQFFSHF